MNLPETITINEVSYVTADLSENARNQVANILQVDAEINRLQQRIAINQTARNAYFAALAAAVATPPVEVSIH